MCCSARCPSGIPIASSCSATPRPRTRSLTRAGETIISLDPATGRSSSTSFSLRTFEEFRAHSPQLSDVFAFAPFNQIDLLVDGVPETEVLGQLASGGYHEGLGVSTILAGR